MSKARDLASFGSAADDIGRRNLIINGAMQVAQRGTSFTAPSAAYTLDRWKAWAADTDGSFDITQVSDAPTGFKSSLKATVTTADTSLGATQFAIIRQSFEGQDIVQTAFGTSGAKTLTLSFYVKSSITGTFGGAFCDDDFTYSFPFSYTVSSANTWERKTVTISGATSGSFPNDNTQGMFLNFSLGTGSTYSGTADTWGSSGYFDVTGTDAVIGTDDATWQITGVQLEVGDTATPFEHRSYGEELALCQRYFKKTGFITRFDSTDSNHLVGLDIGPMRAEPTVTRTSNFWTSSESGTGFSIDDSGLIQRLVLNNSSNAALGGIFTCDAEL